MKKFLLATMIFSLIFAVSGIVLAQELEKIPSPDQIKNFKMIKKDGGSLFGVRIGTASSTINREMNREQEMRKEQEMKKEQEMRNLRIASSTIKATGTASILEKISHPGEIKLFDKIKQIGTSLWGIRKGDIKNPNESQKPMEARPTLVKPVAIECVKNAIDKKDTALTSSMASSSQAMISAINARNACQKLALDKATGQEQFEANKICVNSFQTSSKNTNESLKKARNEAWKIYKDDLKACSVLQRESNATSTLTNSANNEIMINDGEENNEIVK